MNSPEQSYQPQINARLKYASRYARAVIANDPREVVAHLKYPEYGLSTKINDFNAVYVYTHNPELHDTAKAVGGKVLVNAAEIDIDRVISLLATAEAARTPEGELLGSLENIRTKKALAQLAWRSEDEIDTKLSASQQLVSYNRELNAVELSDDLKDDLHIGCPASGYTERDIDKRLPIYDQLAAWCAAATIINTYHHYK